MYVLYELGIFLPVRVRFLSIGVLACENTDLRVSHASCVRLGRTVFNTPPTSYLYKCLKRIITFWFLNLNSLLVTRQIDNPSPAAVTGGN